MPLTTNNYFSSDTQYSYLPPSKPVNDVFKGVNRPQSVLISAPQKKTTPQKRIVATTDAQITTEKTDKVAQYESRAQQRIQRAENITEFYDRTHKELGLSADPTSNKLSQLGAKRFLKENVKYALRLPGEIPGQLAYAGTKIKNVADAAITAVPRSRAEAVEQIFFVPQIVGTIKREAGNIKNIGQKTIRNLRDVAVAGIKPQPLSSVGYGVLTLRMNETKRKEALTVIPKQTESMFDPRNVGGAINVVGAVSGAAIIRRAGKYASYKAASNRIDDLMRDTQKKITIKNAGWSAKYDPQKTEPLLFEGLTNERQTQLRPKNVRSGALFSEQQPIDLGKYDPSKQTKLAEKITIQDAYKKTIIRESPRYDIKFKSDELLAKSVPETKTLPKLRQTELIDEIQVIDPYRKTIIQQSPYGDLVSLPDEFGRSKKIFTRGMFSNKRASFRGSATLEQPKLSPKPKLGIDEDIWGDIKPKPLLDKNIIRYDKINSRIKIPKYVGVAAIKTKQKPGTINATVSLPAVDVAPDIEYIPKQPQKPTPIEKVITRQIPGLITPIRPKLLPTPPEEPEINPEGAVPLGVAPLSSRPPKNRKPKKFMIMFDDVIKRTQKRIINNLQGITRYQPSIVGVITKTKQTNKNKLFSGLEVRGI